MTALARRLSLVIAILALAGVVVSGAALRNHYGHDKTTFCELGENFDCDIVNRSSYSVVMGIPVALIGIMGYFAMLLLSTLYRDREKTPATLFAAALGGLAFALYLTYVEKYILATWCILCLSSLALISSITILASALLANSARRT